MRQWGSGKIWKGLVEEKKLLASYLQGIISIHHPTVCPGGHNQEPSREKGKEASDVLKKLPHLGEQPVWKGCMGSCSPGPLRELDAVVSCASET